MAYRERNDGTTTCHLKEQNCCWSLLNAEGLTLLPSKVAFRSTTLWARSPQLELHRWTTLCITAQQRRDDIPSGAKVMSNVQVFSKKLSLINQLQLKAWASWTMAAFQQAQLERTLEVLRASQSPSTETQTKVQDVSLQAVSTSSAHPLHFYHHHILLF